MSLSFTARRAVPALCFAFALSTFAAAAPAAAPYQAIVSMLDQMTAKAVPTTLRIAIEVLVIGDEDGGKTADRLIAAEKATIDASTSSHFTADSGFSLLGIEERPFAASADATALAEDDKASRSVHGDARFFIMVRIVDYHSGRYDLAETRAQLMDRSSGGKLAIDVAWSSQVDGLERSLFVDGTRIK